MYDDTLKKILDRLRRNGDEVLPPASNRKIAEITSAVRERWNQELPDGFLRFLRTCNGIDYDGLVIYGVGYSPGNESPGGFWQGLLAANDEWHEEDGYEDLLIFGDDDTLLFAKSLKSGFGAYDQGEGDLVQEYRSFDEMLLKALEERL